VHDAGTPVSKSLHPNGLTARRGAGGTQSKLGAAGGSERYGAATGVESTGERETDRFLTLAALTGFP